ncbi:transporter substrate-binding domain-containing protein [Halomonas sp. HP20-15]|uniref:substrate-binding periplasmic protein n=1 Tax=Halomonas sp. HP20-15 TaxID=3085901 RepID=UPI00298270CE|nr:transporter substrate-binding domain-containing protein [Halomonas sp. HP20-15]MDW5376865.1 transporter substrate-binding domain-containing protein [Halomonas sp. HP20-15]
MTSHRLNRPSFPRVMRSLFHFALLAIFWTSANTASADEPLRLLTEELPPLNFRENGELTGLSVALVREIQRRLDNEQPIQLMPWARAYHSLMEKPGVALFSTARSAEREDLFQWVGPLANLAFVFYKRAGSPLTLDNLDDARKLETIATYRNDVREEFLLNHGFTNLDSATKLVSGARKLLEGRVDAWLDSNLSAPSVIESLGYPADSIERLLVAHSEPLYIAFSAETAPETVARWQRTLDAMARDGTFARLHRRWLPNEPMPSRMAALSPDPALTGYPLTLKTEELPPYNFLQDGEADGVSVDIVKEIQRRLGRRTPIEFVPWTRGYQTVMEAAGSALFTTVRNAEREELFQWVGPIGHTQVKLYGRRDSGLAIDSLADARRVESIGTYQDDAGEQYLKRHGFTNLYGHRSAASIARNLAAGRIKLWVSGEQNAAEIIAQSDSPRADFKAFYTLYEARFYIAFSTATPPAVVELWQQTLDAMRADGSLARIYRHWGFSPPGEDA